MRRAVAVIGMLLAAVSVGCGGNSMEEAVDPVAIGPADPAYAARANAICREALGETRRVGREFNEAELDAATPDLLAATTRYLVKPGIEVRARMARRLRGLPPPTRGSASVQAYLDLLDPIEVLARARLRAGFDHDLEKVSDTEALLQELAEEQERAARLAGLDACATNFVTEAFGGGR